MRDDSKDAFDVGYDFRCLDFYMAVNVWRPDVSVEQDDDEVYRDDDAYEDDVSYLDNVYMRTCREERHDTNNDDASHPRNDNLRFRQYIRQHNQFHSHSTQYNLCQ